MRELNLVIAISLATLTGCGPPPSCGADLELDVATNRCRCPLSTPVLVCRTSDDCVCTVDAADGGIDGGADAGSGADATTEWDANDARVCVDETCNGHDDDCDGMVDEGTGDELGCDFGCSSGACATLDDIATGSVHSCALLSNGEVRCWGDNRAGQLGDGTMFNRYTPASVEGLPPARAISTGGDHTCAITRDDSLYCWGGNSFAQIGDGTHENRSTPVLISLTGVRDIMAGGGHTCALLGPDDVRCWGNNNWGQVGNGTTIEASSPTPVMGLTGVTALSSDGGQHTCAIVGGGAVRCWGDNRLGQLGDDTYTPRLTPVTATGLSGITVVANNIFHSCSIGTGGALHCWGDNPDGRLGVGTTMAYRTPRRITISAVTSAAASRFASCASTSDGALHCWGSNDRWQLAQGTSAPATSLAPTVVPSLTRVLEIEGGMNHFCARTEEALYCWGDNQSGQLGVNPVEADRIGVPTEVNL